MLSFESSLNTEVAPDPVKAPFAYAYAKVTLRKKHSTRKQEKQVRPSSKPKGQQRGRKGHGRTLRGLPN